MAALRDNMNLLPDRERKEGEAAVKRAAQPAKAGEVRLSMPQAAKPNDPVKKSWWQSFKEKRAKKVVPVQPAVMSSMKPALPASTKPTAVATKPAPVSPVKPAVAKPIMPAVAKPAPVVSKPAPVVKPAAAPSPKMEPMKPRLIQPQPAVAKTVPAPAKAPSKKMSEPAPDKSGNKMHQPDSVNGFLSPKVNLVPEGTAAEAQGIPWGLYGGIVAVVLGVWVGVSGFAIMRANKAESAISEANARLSQVRTVVKEYEADKNAQLALQKQFIYVKDLIEGHVYWTPFLQKLEETTIPDVYYLGMSANENGEVTLRAVAKNYSAAARQIRAFERASGFVSSIQVSQVRQELQKEATLPVPVIAFDAQIKLVKGIFTISAPEASPTTP